MKRIILKLWTDNGNERIILKNWTDNGNERIILKNWFSGQSKSLFCYLRMWELRIHNCIDFSERGECTEGGGDKLQGDGGGPLSPGSCKHSVCSTNLSKGEWDV